MDKSSTAQPTYQFDDSAKARMALNASKESRRVSLIGSWRRKTTYPPKESTERALGRFETLQQRHSCRIVTAPSRS